MSISSSSSSLMNIGGAESLRQLSRGEMSKEEDETLLWLSRFPVERNHPRATAPNVAPLWKSDEVMVAHTYNTVTDVFGQLIKEGFLSCPVLDNSDNFVGFVDMLALVNHALTVFDVWRLKEKDIANLKDEASIWTRFYEQADFRNTRVSAITEVPDWKAKYPFFPVYQGFSLLYVVELMARLGSHRVPVLCPSDRKVCGIITQSMVISLIDQEMNRLGAMRNTPITEMLAGLTNQLHTVTVNTTAAEAFKKMVLWNVSGLPIVDEEGALDDTISARDLRGIGPGAGNFDLMWNSCSVFKDKCRKLFPNQTPRRPIFVTEQDNFAKLITNMRDGNIHRVFVCKLNANGKPIPTHVVSQRDVMRFLIFRLGMTPAPSATPPTIPTLASSTAASTI